MADILWLIGTFRATKFNQVALKVAEVYLFHVSVYHDAQKCTEDVLIKYGQPKIIQLLQN